MWRWVILSREIKVEAENFSQNSIKSTAPGPGDPPSSQKTCSETRISGHFRSRRQAERHFQFFESDLLTSSRACSGLPFPNSDNIRREIEQKKVTFTFFALLLFSHHHPKTRKESPLTNPLNRARQERVHNTEEIEGGKHQRQPRIYV